MSEVVDSHEHYIHNYDLDEYPIGKKTIPYPHCSATKFFSWVAIAMSAAIALSCFTLAGIILSSPPSLRPHDLQSQRQLDYLPYDQHMYNMHASTFAYRTHLSTKAAQFLALVINLIVTICTDLLGSVHATSLRWALYREKRLAHNTNMRLFRSARSLPNHWITNLIAGTSFSMCYAASSILFLKTCSTVCVSAIALCFLGVGLSCQALVASLCMRNANKLIPTWSSNPLANTLACLEAGATVYLASRTGRCMLSFDDNGEPASPSVPGKCQNCLAKTPGVSHVLGLIWTINFILAAWGVGFHALTWRSGGKRFISMNWSNLKSPATHNIWAFFYVFALQAVQGIVLHCMELIISMARDEQIWRDAATLKGAALDTNPLVSALISWRAFLLVIIKSSLHWMLGKAFHVEAWLLMWTSFPPDEFPVAQGSFTLKITAEWVLWYAATAIAASLIVTCIAFWIPDGPQPAAYGHLQTLADLVDQWPNHQGGKLWWGDKGVGEDGITRHAGTSASRTLIGDIIPTATYA